MRELRPGNSRKDIEGVSPIVGTLLMIAITVSLSGSVYLMASNYQNMAHGGVEIVNIRVSVHTKGIQEVYSDGTPTGHTYSGLKVEVMSKSFQWGHYKVILASEVVFTVPSSTVLVGEIPDANDEPAPYNYGGTFAGGEQWFSEEAYRNDLLPLTYGTYYDVRIVNINTNSLVWRGEVRAI